MIFQASRRAWVCSSQFLLFLLWLLLLRVLSLNPDSAMFKVFTMRLSMALSSMLKFQMLNSCKERNHSSETYWLSHGQEIASEHTKEPYRSREIWTSQKDSNTPETWKSSTESKQLQWSLSATEQPISWPSTLKLKTLNILTKPRASGGLCL